MKNLKEIKPILTAIYCINNVKRENRDDNINNILDYAFRRIFNGNTNILNLCCLGKNEITIITDIEELLETTTEYIKYKEMK